MALVDVYRRLKGIGPSVRTRDLIYRDYIASIEFYDPQHWARMIGTLVTTDGSAPGEPYDQSTHILSHMSFIRRKVVNSDPANVQAPYIQEAENALIPAIRSERRPRVFETLAGLLNGLDADDLGSGSDHTGQTGWDERFAQDLATIIDRHKFVHETVASLADRDIGIGTPKGDAGVSGYFEGKLIRAFRWAISHNRTDILSNLRDITGDTIERYITPSNTAILPEVKKRLVGLMKVVGIEVKQRDLPIRLQTEADLRDFFKKTWDTIFSQTAGSHGRSGDLSEDALQSFKAASEYFAHLSKNEQSTFLMRMTDSFINLFAEGSQYADLDGRMTAFRTVLRMISDSAVIESVEERQGTGGAKASKTIDSVRRYFIQRVMGIIPDTDASTKIRHGDIVGLAGNFLAIVRNQEDSSVPTDTEVRLARIIASGSVELIARTPGDENAGTFFPRATSLYETLSKDFYKDPHIFNRLIFLFRLMSPRAYGQLTHLIPGGIDELNKTRRDPGRHSRIKDGMGFYAAHQVSGKYYHGLPETPAIDLIPQICQQYPDLSKLWTTLLKEADRYIYPSVDTDTSETVRVGHDHLLSKEENGVQWAQVRTDLFTEYAQETFGPQGYLRRLPVLSEAELADPSKAEESKRQVALAQFTIIAWGTMLEPVEGESEKLKSPVREQFLNFVADSLSHEPRMPEPIRTACRNVLQYNIPFYTTNVRVDPSTGRGVGDASIITGFISKVTSMAAYQPTSFLYDLRRVFSSIVVHAPDEPFPHERIAYDRSQMRSHVITSFLHAVEVEQRSRGDGRRGFAVLELLGIDDPSRLAAPKISFNLRTDTPLGLALAMVRTFFGNEEIDADILADIRRIYVENITSGLLVAFPRPPQLVKYRGMIEEAVPSLQGPADKLAELIDFAMKLPPSLPPDIEHLQSELSSNIPNQGLNQQEYPQIQLLEAYARQSFSDRCTTQANEALYEFAKLLGIDPESKTALMQGVNGILRLGDGPLVKQDQDEIITPNKSQGSQVIVAGGLGQGGLTRLLDLMQKGGNLGEAMKTLPQMQSASIEAGQLLIKSDTGPIAVAMNLRTLSLQLTHEAVREALTAQQTLVAISEALFPNLKAQVIQLLQINHLSAISSNEQLGKIAQARIDVVKVKIDTQLEPIKRQIELLNRLTKEFALAYKLEQETSAAKRKLVADLASEDTAYRQRLMHALFMGIDRRPTSRGTIPQIEATFLQYMSTMGLPTLQSIEPDEIKAAIFPDEQIKSS